MLGDIKKITYPVSYALSSIRYYANLGDLEYNSRDTLGDGTHKKNKDI